MNNSEIFYDGTTKKTDEASTSISLPDTEEPQELWKTDIDKADEKINLLNEKLERREIKYIEIIGIFVTIFTFISINFQILQLSESLEKAVGLILILLGSMLFLIISLDIILNEIINFTPIIKGVFILCTLSILIGIFLVIFYQKNFKTNDLVRCITNTGEEISPGKVKSIAGQIISVESKDNKTQTFFFRQCEKEKFKK